MLLQQREVETNAAIDGAACGDGVDAKPFDGVDEDACTEVYFMAARLFDDDIVVRDVARVLIVYVYIDGAGIGVAIVGLAVADDGGYPQPWENGNLIAGVDDKGLVVFPQRVGNMVVGLVVGWRYQEIEVDAPNGEADADAEVGILCAETGRAELETEIVTAVVLCEVEPLCIRGHGNGEECQGNECFFHGNCVV